MEKVCCGGFYLGEGLELDGRTLKATGGSSPVPDPEVADIGKVLGIVEDGAGAKYAPVEGGGSGLPDPSTLPDGTVMVAVNGEWKMQDGYGYTDDPAFEPITWDGNTEGREVYGGIYYKVSGTSISAADIIGSTFIAYEDGEEDSQVISSITEQSEGYSVEGVIWVKDDGVYFIAVDGAYVSSLTAPPSVHKFDPALVTFGIEQFPVVLRYSAEDMAYVSDKSIDEIRLACKPNIIIKGYVVESSMGSSWLNEISFNPVQESFLYCQTVDNDGTPALGYTYFTYNSETEKWDITVKYVSFDT